jgi:hypothetical protein
VAPAHRRGHAACNAAAAAHHAVGLVDHVPHFDLDAVLAAAALPIYSRTLNISYTINIESIRLLIFYLNLWSRNVLFNLK